MEFIPLAWEGEMPGWNVRWLHSTESAHHLREVIRESYLPITQQQPNVIANFKISPWNEVAIFLTERDCRELLKMLDEAIRVARPSILWQPE